MHFVTLYRGKSNQVIQKYVLIQLKHGHFAVWILKSAKTPAFQGVILR